MIIDRFHKYGGLSDIREEQLFLTENLRQRLLRAFASFVKTVRDGLGAASMNPGPVERRFAPIWNGRYSRSLHCAGLACARRLRSG
jgi:hypothetical protein